MAEFLDPSPNDRANQCIEARTIPAASEYAKSHLAPPLRHRCHAPTPIYDKNATIPRLSILRRRNPLPLRGSMRYWARHHDTKRAR